MSNLANPLVSQMSVASIEDALRVGGYAVYPGMADAVKRAAAKGCLLWTSERLTTTDSSRIDARPQRAAKE
jgi:hypothetical protein